MARKRHTAEEIVVKLRQVDVLSGEWTFQAVATAFADVLTDRQHTLGLTVDPVD